MTTLADDRAKAFVGAAARGDLETVRRMLADGVDVNARNERGSTALQIAAHFGKEDVVRALLPHDPELSIRANDGWRALTSAAANTFATPGGRTQVLRILLEHGDRPEPDDADWKALHYAAQWGNAAEVTLLVAHGMDPDLRDPDGLTPLMRAARKGKVDVVRALIDAGATTGIEDPGGRTALDLARAARKARVVELLEGTR